MIDPARLISDPTIPPEDETDPEAPRLIDLDNPEPEPGTDIVPPDDSDEPMFPE
jgi:hypothetical protein